MERAARHRVYPLHRRAPAPARGAEPVHRPVRRLIRLPSPRAPPCPPPSRAPAAAPGAEPLHRLTSPPPDQASRSCAAPHPPLSIVPLQHLVLSSPPTCTLQDLAPCSPGVDQPAAWAVPRYCCAATPLAGNSRLHYTCLRHSQGSLSASSEPIAACV